MAAIRAAGGEIYAITSEPQALANNAQKDWDTDLAHIGDPHHEIADECRQRGWLSLFTNEWESDTVETGRTWMSHPRGFFQPGVLACSRQGRVLYRWRCRPNRKNIGGAIARPTPSHVWSRVQAALEEPPDAPDVTPDADPVLDAEPISWPLFVAQLLANGWFLRPVPFDQRPGENTALQRRRRAMLRIPFFVAAWIAAAVVLPIWLVGLAFAGWVAKVVPGIRRVNARFQNVGPDEEPA